MEKANAQTKTIQNQSRKFSWLKICSLKLHVWAQICIFFRFRRFQKNVLRGREVNFVALFTILYKPTYINFVLETHLGYISY